MTEGHACATLGGNFQRSPSSRNEIIMSVNADLIKQITAIVCKDIPDEENDRETVAAHFRRFGTVTRLSCHAGRQQAIVHFKTHVSYKFKINVLVEKS